MGPFLISLIVGVSASAWIYNKFMNSTGGNTKSALMTAGFSGLGIMIALFILLSFIL